MFKVIKNRKCSGCVERQELRSIDRNYHFFFQTKATQFKAIITRVNEDNNDKAKVPDEFFF